MDQYVFIVHLISCHWATELLLSDILEPPLHVGLLWCSLNLNRHGRWDILSHVQHVMISQFHFP